MNRFLTAEVTRVRRFTIRVHHLLLVALVALLVGIGLGILAEQTAYPYRTLPAPPVPKGQTQPDQCGGGTDHNLGDCLPAPKGVKHASLGLSLAAFTTGITGPDLSNNDPVTYSGSWRAIAAHSRFAYVKSVEGTGFTDGYARTMASLSKAFGLPVGGYDFQHVCGDSAVAEADHFVGALRAQGLLGKGTLPPAADSEYGSGSCGGRSWLQQWVNEVYNQDGHICPIDYTGAWWWQPQIGSFWPTCRNRQLLTWISGYGVSYPYMPSGVSHLDFWQFSDHGWNGASTGDLSAWQHGNAAFVAFAHAVPPADKYAILDKTKRHLRKGATAAEYATVKTSDRLRCHAHRTRRGCASTRYHARLLADRDVRVACHGAPYHSPTFGKPCDYGVRHLGARQKWLRAVSQ